jgi:hypothetical protein
MRPFTCVVLAAISLAPGVFADDVLDVRLSSQVMTAPGHVKVTIIVERDENNRLMTVEADSAAFYRSSQIPLDGAKAPRTYAFTYGDLPEGTYVIRVTVRDQRGTVAVDRKSLEVRP